MQHLLRIGNEAGQRSENHSGREITQNGPEPDLLEQRCGDNGTAEQHDGIDIDLRQRCQIGPPFVAWIRTRP